MNEEVDDIDFYHQDFTTASEWEIFTARIEEILHEWKLTQSRQNLLPPLGEGDWESSSETLQFADNEFSITHHYIKPLDEECPADVDRDEEKHNVLEELRYTGDDFCSLKNESSLTPAHYLAHLYGLRDFVIISPCRTTEIDNESKIKVLMSSLHIAANNCNCEVPLFVQIRQEKQNCYLGVYESRGIRTNFEMVHLWKGPQHCKFLTGLIDLFKTKIASPVSLDTICVSVQFTYVLTNFLNNSWTQDPPDFDFMHGESIGISNLGSLPFGATFDPVSEMHLKATWQNLPENLVVDSENYSDFEPHQAQKWSVKIKMAESPACLLSECLLEFLQMCSHNLTLSDVLGDFVSESSSETNNPLNRITESHIPSLSTVLKRAAGQARKHSKSQEGPVSEDLLLPILYFLFPDAENEPSAPYKTVNEVSSDTGTLKSSGADSLLWRLAIVLAHGAHSFGGLRTVAHLWYEFVQEMRFRWEHSILVPGLPSGFPDPRTCLLHQKLQLLNCCVERKLKRETSASGTSSGRCNSNDSEQNDSFEEPEEEEDEDDEFFDCSTEEQAPKYSLWNQPVGRLQKHENMKLLKTGEPLYIPITQEAVPKTEDQLEEDADVLLQLGTDALGSELRARMMSASLLSDMESFKAANPGAVLEDFIRWYSPRDWIEIEGEDEWGQRNGHLSSRMQIEDNTWVVVWESAKPVPARRQKRLFDDTREAEKVLHYLESRTISQVVELLLPVLTHAAICRLVLEVDKKELPSLSESIKHVVKTSERVSRDARPAPRKYEYVYQEMAGIEALIAQADSLRHKFNPAKQDDEKMTTFLAGLLENKEMAVYGGPRETLGCRIANMFQEARKAAQLISDDGQTDETWSTPATSSFPRPSQKEFIMRVAAYRPVIQSTMTPQLLHAVLSRDEFRLAGAFSQDTIFF